MIAIWAEPWSFSKFSRVQMFVSEFKGHIVIVFVHTA